MPKQKYRKFDKTKYAFNTHRRLKRTARSRARILRKMGLSVRMIKSKKYGWVLYTKRRD